MRVSNVIKNRAVNLPNFQTCWKEMIPSLVGIPAFSLQPKQLIVCGPMCPELVGGSLKIPYGITR